MDANKEALAQLNESLLDLAHALERTKGRSDVPAALQENVSQLFRYGSFGSTTIEALILCVPACSKLSYTAAAWSKLRHQRSPFLRFLMRDDISDDIMRLKEDITTACNRFIVSGGFIL